MPFKSKAQVAKFGEMVKQGKMTQEEFDKWKKETPNMHKLPERITPKKPKSVQDLKKIKEMKYGKK